jgi:predicted esterase
MKTLLALLLTMASTAAIETEAKSFKATDETEVLYRFAASTKIEEGKKYPLILFLHGSGQRGNDNKAQLNHGPEAMLEMAEKLGQPAFLIAPQCPSDKTWAPYRTDPDSPADGTLANPLLDAVLALVDETAATQPIDRKRIYITGLSMGGFGTWAAIARKPELFAAAIPICGGGDPRTATRFKDMPIRIFHGDADNVCSMHSRKQAPKRSSLFIPASVTTHGRKPTVILMLSSGCFPRRKKIDAFPEVRGRGDHSLAGFLAVRGGLADTAPLRLGEGICRQCGAERLSRRPGIDRLIRRARGSRSLFQPCAADLRAGASARADPPGEKAAPQGRR